MLVVTVKQFIIDFIKVYMKKNSTKSKSRKGESRLKEILQTPKKEANPGRGGGGGGGGGGTKSIKYSAFVVCSSGPL